MKQMLKVWGFNDPYTGGLSSYALFLMIVSFLQETKKPTDATQVNLGEVLLELIKYYSELDTVQNAIACRMPGSTFDTRNVYPSNDTNFYFMAPHVVIDDPLNQGNNVGKSSFRYPNIKQILGLSFHQAFTGCFCSCHMKTVCGNS
jgi:DNA polymerase sigma